VAAPAVPQSQEDRDDPRMLASQFELVQRELRRVQDQLADLQDALAQTQQAASTVRSLADAKGVQDTFIPIGAGVHLRARIDPSEPALVPLGAGYASEDSLSGVAELLDKRVAQLSGSFQQLSQEAERLARTAGAINDRLLSLQGAGGA